MFWLDENVAFFGGEISLNYQHTVPGKETILSHIINI